MVGDIAGKGIAAALLMANLQANLRSQCAIALEHPQRFLESVNRLFFENTIESAYATLFFAEYDSRARRLRYANCGHLPGLLLRSDGTLDRLRSTCTVLGLFKDWDCSIGESSSASGRHSGALHRWRHRSFSTTGEEFGEQRLVDSLRRHRDQRPQALLNSILDDVKRSARMSSTTTSRCWLRGAKATLLLQ